MVVQHNLTAMNANRMLGLTTSSQAKSTEKLSSGYKINRAADDAAGLSISEKMRKQIRGLSQASLNAQDGISAVQTAEGALTEVHDMLQRMNELAVKAANGTMSEDDRSYVQDEIDQLVTEIDRVSETTKFNETYLLKGTTGTKTVETEASVTVSYEPSITGEEKLEWNAAGATTLYATKDGKSVEIAESNYKDYVELDKRSVVDSVKINDSSQVFTETGTTALSGAQLKAALNAGETLYTSKAQTAAAEGTGNDYEIVAGSAAVGMKADGITGITDYADGDITVGSAVAGGTYTYDETAQVWVNQDTGAETTEIKVGNGKSATDGDSITVTAAKANITAGVTLYAEGGKDPLTADQVLAAHNAKETLYTDAYSERTEAVEGVDYTAETHEETFIKAKDGWQIYKIDADETTQFGDQLTNQVATETDLNSQFNVKTDLLYAKDANGDAYTVSADELANFFDENGVYQGGLYSYTNVAKPVFTEIGAEQIDDYVVWDRVEASTEEVETEEALTFSLQVGADTTPENKITIDIESMSAKGLGIEGLRVDGADSTNADAAVEVIADAIQKVSTQRSALGAVQNRLEHTINNLDNVVENTTSAESQIRDTDMATEMVKYSNNNILAQAGQAMLAQANQSNQGVLSLLG